MSGDFSWLACCRSGAKPLGRRALGLILIFVTAIIWVAASFLSSLLVSSKPGGSQSMHVPPLLLTYLATSVFTFFLPIVHVKKWTLKWLEAR